MDDNLMDQIAVKIKLQADVSAEKQIDGALDTIKKKSKTTSEMLDKLKSSLNEAIGELKSKEGVDKATVNVSKLGDKIRITSSYTDELKQKITGIKKLDFTPPKVEPPKIEPSKWDKIKNDLGKQSEKLLDKITSPFKKFLRVGIYRLFRMAVQSVFDAMKEGVSIARDWSETYGNGNLARSLDRIEESAYRIKKAFGAIAEPLINAVAPAIDWLSKRIVDLSNRLSRFVASLSGQDYFLQATYDTSGLKAMKDDIDGVGKASSSAKEKLKSFTLGFDELNVLAKDSPLSGSGSGGSGSSAVDDIKSNINDFYTKLPTQDLSDFNSVEKFGINFFDLLFGSDAKDVLKDEYEKSGFGNALVWLFGEVIPEGIRNFAPIKSIRDAMAESENPIIRGFSRLSDALAEGRTKFARSLSNGNVTRDVKETLIDPILSFPARIEERLKLRAIEELPKHADESFRKVGESLKREVGTAGDNVIEGLSHGFTKVGNFWDRELKENIKGKIVVNAVNISDAITDVIEGRFRDKRNDITKVATAPFGDIPDNSIFTDAISKITDKLGKIANPVSGNVSENIRKGLMNDDVAKQVSETAKLIKDNLSSGVKDGLQNESVTSKISDVGVNISKSLTSGVKNGLSTDSTKTSFTTLKNNFDNTFKSVLTSPVFKNAIATGTASVGDTIKNGVNSGMKDKSILSTASTTGQNITNKLNENIKNVALKVSGEEALGKITTATSTIKDHLNTINTTNLPNFKKAIDGVKSSVEGMEGAFSRTKSLSGDLLSNTSQMYNGILDKVGSLLGIKIPKIPAFADGGFPDMSGELFIARESGNEFVGRMGNRSVVGNNEQIVEGVASGVESANQGVINAIYDLLTVVRDKDTIVNISATDIGKANDYYTRTKGTSVSSGALTNTY